MNHKNKIGKNILVVLLFVVFMLPTAIQFFHLFDEAHEHITCTEKKDHLHQSTTNCDICSFHFTAFNYDLAPYPNFILPTIPVKEEASFASLQYHSFKITNTRLRAPPINS